MSDELHEYNLGDMTLILPRNWVPIEDLEKFANELGFESNNTMEDILVGAGIEIQGDEADFNGIHFYLLGKGLISYPFISKLMEYNFDDEYVDILNFTDYLLGLHRNVASNPASKDVQMVVSALKEMVAVS